jgi:cytochrome c peroxidase
MKKSLTETMLGPKPDDGDAEAVLAYLKNLEPPPNPFRQPDGSLTAAAQRGKVVFESDKAACATCHSGPYYTDGQVHDVGLGSPRDRYKGFNTPTLRGVYQKVKLLHDGSCDNLLDVVTGLHAPLRVAGIEELSEQEAKDLVEYLQSL